MSVPVRGLDARFPINRLFFVGRNYHAHAVEMGRPVDKSVERHLFEPFFSSESRSSGLGLYICRELCQRHGASISYQRTTRDTARGKVGGNAFTVAFRRTTRPVEPATLFDSIVI